MNIIYDEMDNEDKRLCPCCNEWVDRYDEWDKEYEACVYCSENDDNYQQHLKKQRAYESHIDYLIDVSRGK